MDHEKYYRIMHDGTYCIHFSNKKGFSKEEINTIFSSYGDILNMSWKGDIISGLIFIRYKTLQETLRCLKSLQKSNDIYILPQKDKIGKQKVQQNSNEWQAGRTDNSLKVTFVNDKQYHSNTTCNNQVFTCEEKPTYKRNSAHTNNHCSSKLKHNYKFYANAMKSDMLNPSVVDEKNLQYPKQEDHDNKISSCNQVTKQWEAKLYGLSKPEVKPYSIWDKHTFNDSEIPSLISDPEIKLKESSKKIDHSLPTCIKDTLHKSIVIMQEIVVANIHENYNVHYILHLFEKHSPISATLVKTIFKTNIRYCFVYFMNEDDALAIEKKFDNFKLSGRNLIVLRKSQLNKAMYK